MSQPMAFVSLVAAPDVDGDEHMDSMSPPRVSKNSNGEMPSADLFGDTETTNNNSRTGRRRRLRTRLSGSPNGSFISDVSADESVLRNMDINASSPSSGATRKRPSDHYPAGREDFMEESDDDMFVSPRPSPTYRTLDGRTVTSKNPILALYTGARRRMHEYPNFESAPTFPVTLHSSHSFDSNDSKLTDTSTQTQTHTGLKPKLSVIRRDTSVFASQQSAAGRAGYPDQHGRYSFTGSPIQEIDIMEEDSNMGSKIRRLTLSDTAASSTTAHSLFVDTARNVTDKNTTVDDGISPNDVANFPTPPSAPKKAARPRYTPLKAAPPQTPMPARRNVARMPHDDEDEAMMDDAPQQKSRFYQDFDIIGELGTGSFGTVFKCLSRLDGCMYAVKAAKRKAKGNADRDRMLKEVSESCVM